MQNHLPFEQKKLRARKRKKTVLWVIFWIFCAALFVYGIVCIVSLNAFKINTLSIWGTDRVSLTDVHALASADMENKSLWIFPDSSWFFVSTRRISADILKNFSAVDSVSVHRSGLTSLSIDIQEKSPEALWCDDASCMVLDETGTAFDVEPKATTTDMAIFESSTTPAIGASPVSGGFAQILIFINALAARGLNPTIANVETGEIDITVASSSEIIIDPTKDLTQALANLDLILSNPQSPLQKDNIDKVQYIDLRFDGKVFYKNDGSSS